MLPRHEAPLFWHCFAAAKDKICFINTNWWYATLFSLSFLDVYGSIPWNESRAVSLCLCQAKIPWQPTLIKCRKVGSKLPFVILKNNNKVSEFIESLNVYLLYVYDRKKKRATELKEKINNCITKNLGLSS